MDNVRFHHSKDVLEYFKSRNIDILFVPPYSPWFNPIENAFSLIKKHFYKHGKINEAFEYVCRQKEVLRKMFDKII